MKSINFLTQIQSSKRIIFGFEALRRVSESLKLLNSVKSLVVTDENLVKIGLVDELLRYLDESGVEYEIYSKVEPEPSVETVDEIMDLIRCLKIDSVIGFGGGSCLDAAKAASIALQNPGSILNYLGSNLVKRKGVNIIGIPTTAGTGSEVTKYAVLTYGKEKRTMTSYHIIPDIAIVDPQLTVTLPPKLTAGTGVDALSHAIEAFLSIWSNPVLDSIALTAVSLIFKYLRKAYENGENLEARYYMSMAATAAGIPLCSAGVLVGHSIAQAFAPLKKIHHGLSCGIVLPYITKFYIPSSKHKIAKIADVIGIDVSRVDLDGVAHMVVEEIFKLLSDLKIPLSLKELGITRDQLPYIAKTAIKNWPRPNSPQPLNYENVLGLVEEIWYGKQF